MYNNNTKKTDEKQIQILHDYTTSGRKIDWVSKKKRNLLLAESYKRLGFRKAYFVQDCSTLLQYKVFKGGVRKLHGLNSCRDRLCPICAWRRSLKIFGQTSKIMNIALENKDYRFIFLTLTCKSVQASDLDKTLDDLFKAFNLMTKRKLFKKSIKGWFRALEITHNLENNTYHPHFHLILMVNKSYFNNRNYYISQSNWSELWKSCLDVAYVPVVDVRVFKMKSRKEVKRSVAETAKYTVKDNDFLIKGDEKTTDEIVKTLNFAMKSRRLIAFGGELRKIHKALNLDDIKNGDLVHVNDDDEVELREDVDYVIESYKWNVGYKQYLKV
ncbi:protein rep [Clostridium tyrobutyricum]|uniref:protein rep n=1 Tax=Clostridium tyrobutyricum TaxID=1519 RepID=UPI0010AAC314|nr:protein rep [Clostridium tyrobutyricum]MBV4429683.1 protein rep [Clostridium tyrobutyricum]MBV4444934.1 protein rep [Clostridium tyrobutyricum]QCH29499.1 Replication protein [Clostridium tyrobutyricum]